MKNKFAVFILSHGRADNLKTLGTLRRQGYTGKIYVILDNEDDQIDEYKKIKDIEVIVFDKLQEMEYSAFQKNSC